MLRLAINLVCMQTMHTELRLRTPMAVGLVNEQLQLKIVLTAKRYYD